MPQQIPAVIEAVLQDRDIGIQAQLVEHLGHRVAKNSDLALNPEQGERQATCQLYQIFTLVFRQVDVLLLGVPLEQGIALFKGQALQAYDLSLGNALAGRNRNL